VPFPNKNRGFQNRRTSLCTARCCRRMTEPGSDNEPQSNPARRDNSALPIPCCGFGWDGLILPHVTIAKGDVDDGEETDET
jgi:hypothetical protein